MRVIADLPPNVNALGNLAEDQYPLLGVMLLHSQPGQ